MTILRQVNIISASIVFMLMMFDGVAAVSEKKKGLSNLSSSQPYHGQLGVNAVGGNEDGSFASLDLLYPVYQRSDSLAFVDVRGMMKKSPINEFNIGGGYRWLNADSSHLYGAYGFYDRKTSVNNFSYDQITLGGEFKTQQWLMGGNVYIPMGTTKNTFNLNYS